MDQDDGSSSSEVPLLPCQLSSQDTDAVVQGSTGPPVVVPTGETPPVFVQDGFTFPPYVSGHTITSSIESISTWATVVTSYTSSPSSGVTSAASAISLPFSSGSVASSVESTFSLTSTRVAHEGTVGGIVPCIPSEVAAASSVTSSTVSRPTSTRVTEEAVYGHNPIVASSHSAGSGTTSVVSTLVSPSVAASSDTSNVDFGATSASSPIVSHSASASSPIVSHSASVSSSAAPYASCSTRESLPSIVVSSDVLPFGAGGTSAALPTVSLVAPTGPAIEGDGIVVEEPFVDAEVRVGSFSKGLKSIKKKFESIVGRAVTNLVNFLMLTAGPQLTAILTYFPIYGHCGYKTCIWIMTCVSMTVVVVSGILTFYRLGTFCVDVGHWSCKLKVLTDDVENFSVTGLDGLGPTSRVKFDRMKGKMTRLGWQMYFFGFVSFTVTVLVVGLSGVVAGCILVDSVAHVCSKETYTA